MRERDAQIRVIHELQRRCARDATWWAVPNSMSANATARARAKEEGLRPGVPDLCFLKAGKPLYIEMKSENSGRSTIMAVTDAQVALHREITDAGGRVAVCFGVDETLKQLEDWRVLERRCQR